MNKAVVNAQEVPLPSWSPFLCGFALKVLEEIKKKTGSFRFFMRRQNNKRIKRKIQEQARAYRHTFFQSGRCYT